MMRPTPTGLSSSAPSSNRRASGGTITAERLPSSRSATAEILRDRRRARHAVRQSVGSTALGEHQPCVAEILRQSYALEHASPETAERFKYAQRWLARIKDSEAEGGADCRERRRSFARCRPLLRVKSQREVMSEVGPSIIFTEAPVGPLDDFARPLDQSAGHADPSILTPGSPSFSGRLQCKHFGTDS
jgi:hypothetical protein